MDLGLTNRVAIVTGASRGIGRAAVMSLMNEGASVIAVARSKQALDEMTQQAGDRLVGVPADVTDPDDVAQLPDRAVEKFGSVDILVNNVGGGMRKPFLDLSAKDWEHQLRLNLLGAVDLTREVGRLFVEQRRGRVINTASTASVRGVAGLVSYAAVKGAVLQFTRSLAVEWARYGITVNAVGPGATATEPQRRLLEGPSDELEERLDRIPDHRMADPSEVAAVICFLASDLASHITGEIVMIDGGESVAL